jgi:threonine aldolase
MDYEFGSDNHAGIHPNILCAVSTMNEGHDIAYGGDAVTQRVQKKFKEMFGEEAEVFFVFNGTGANVVCLSAMTSDFHAIICAETAHINVDECGAPEHYTGCKLLTVPAPDGKIKPEDVEKHFHAFGFQHHAQPKVISISQPTELGTVYTPLEIKTLSDLAHARDMYLHMDGSRLVNAAAALGLPFRAFTVDCGVDALSFGGTKAGLMIGEAVLFFRPELAKNAVYLSKQAMQLYSKMRFIAVQFEAFFYRDLWKTIASHSNSMATLLATEMAKLPEVKITQPVQSNGVFATLPKNIIEALQKHYFFYVWNEDAQEIRLMTSFASTSEKISEFINTLSQLINPEKNKGI